MRLKSVKFTEFEDETQEWVLDELSLGANNLIVGKNASGKSRTLNVISALARHLAGLQPPGFSAKYDVTFEHNNEVLRYELKIKQEEVLEEKFTVDGRVLLERGERGIGEIWTQKESGGSLQKFQTPPGVFAAVARRDSIQHPFFEPLYDWGSSLRHYQFGTPMGKQHYAVLTDKGNNQPDGRNPNEVVGIYRQAVKEFGSEFEQSVIEDMVFLGYEIESIQTDQPISIQLETSGSPLDLISLNVKEKSLKGVTDQNSMSQGMFRALSILVQVTYSQMAKKAGCILIDDIGEGLDFDRSCRLINILRAKANKSSVQLILSTNDRFVMNEVPLKEWSVLQRESSHVRVRNYENSREIFEDFRFTGLSNFSFLEMDFINEPPLEEVAAHE